MSFGAQSIDRTLFTPRLVGEAGRKVITRIAQAVPIPDRQGSYERSMVNAL